MYHLLENDLDPRRRRLKAREWGFHLVYWLFPE